MTEQRIPPDADKRSRPKKNSLWADAWRRLRKNRMAVICGWIFFAIAAACYLGPTVIEWITGMTPTSQDAAARGAAPSWQHWFGTDTLGRDMLSRTLKGGQLAIGVGFIATAVALVIGVTWGAISAYAGGKVDEVMMRVVDVLYAFPTVVFVIVIIAMFDLGGSLFWLFALIGLISWLTMARIVRGQVLSLRRQEFVEAARCIGVPRATILFRHIVPNTLGVVIVYSTLSVPAVMLQEAFLSFLGLGVQAPKASWGTLVTEGASQILALPWTLIFPGIMMGITIFSLNFLGDGLRDALDPQMRKD
jgi:oligopeptide transport system permease protein